MSKLEIIAPTELIDNAIDALADVQGVSSSEDYEVKKAAATDQLLTIFREAILSYKKKGIRETQHTDLNIQLNAMGDAMSAQREDITVVITKDE